MCEWYEMRYSLFPSRIGCFCEFSRSMDSFSVEALRFLLIWCTALGFVFFEERMMDGVDGHGSHDNREGQEQSIRSSVRDPERFLPIANINRIMRKVLPSNAKIAKDAKDVVQECVSEFITYVTSTASDKCIEEKRKTINGYDLLYSLAIIGFWDYIPPLKNYLSRYRQFVIQSEGGTTGSSEGADGAPTEEKAGTQLGSDAEVPQFAHQGSYPQDPHPLDSNPPDSYLQDAFPLDSYSQDFPSLS